MQGASDAPAPSERAGAPERVTDGRVAVGMVFILTSGVIFAFMSVLTRIVSDNGMPAMQIVLVSGAVRWLGLVGTVWRAGQSPIGPPGSRLILVIRSLCGMTAFSCATYAFGVTPIGDATTIFLTSPVWAALLGRIVLKEKLHPTDALTIVFALVGVVLVARPEAIFGGAQEKQVQTGGLPGPWVVLVGAVFAASVVICVGLLKRQKLHPAVIAHAYAALTVLVSPLGLLLPGQWPVLTDLDMPVVTWVACAGIGVLAIPNQLLVNAGLLRTPAALGSTMRLIDVPCAFALQVAIFGQVPRATSVFGAALVMLCTVGAAFRKWKQSRGEGLMLNAAKHMLRPRAFGRLREESSSNTRTATAPPAVAEGGVDPPDMPEQVVDTGFRDTGTELGSSTTLR